MATTDTSDVGIELDEPDGTNKLFRPAGSVGKFFFSTFCILEYIVISFEIS